MSNLKYNQLEMQSYLQTSILSLRKQTLLFKFRCRMINVGSNFGRQNKCPICLTGEDSQEHLFNCHKLNDSSSGQSEYSDLFGDNLENFQKVINEGAIILRKREQIISKIS